MFLFTQVGITSTTVEQASLVQNALAPETAAETSKSVTVLPKPLPPKPKAEVQLPLNVEQMVKKFFASTPVLADIARCESTYRQFDNAGNILRGKINKKDIGVMQINEQFHASRAESLGIDLYTLEGNLAYAKRLYKEQGTLPWISSEGCWGSVIASAN